MAGASISRSPSRSPRRRNPPTPPRRGRSPARCHRHEVVVHERIIREGGGSVQYPVLTRTNYADWAIIMRVQLQAQGLWDAVNLGDVNDNEDRLVLAALLRAVPPELVRTLAARDNAKAAWDTLKTLRVSDDRVREAKAQVHHREFDQMRFKDRESIEEFALRLMTLVNDLETLGDPIDEHKAVRKFLRVVPQKYRHMATSIETLLDLRTMSIEELSGRLLTVEENSALDSDDHSGRLLLTSEEWEARRKATRGNGTSGSDNQKKPKGGKSGGGGGKTRGCDG